MIVVADAGPILHLHWIGCSAWALPSQPIYVVEDVWREVERHAPGALEDPRFERTPTPAGPAVDAVRLSLDAGEAAAIAFALGRPGSLLLTDDEAARRACVELHIIATGTIGLIIEAARGGRVPRDEAARSLESLPTRGRLHVSGELLARALAALAAMP